MNQHYFDVPFGFAGDVTPIPDPLQAGGTVSMTEGWNYNYQRDLTTDPLALPIDRSTMNWLFLQITTAIQALQGETVPEFILASQNGGAAYSYGPQAVVLWSSSGTAPFTKFVNVKGSTNTNTPSLSDPTGATTGWQIACDPIATSAQAAAGTNNAAIMTPLLVAQQTALRALLAGNATQVFNVGTPVAASHAIPLGASVQPAVEILYGQVLAPNSGYSTGTFSFTAPTKGTVLAFGSMNLSNETGSPSATISTNLMVNGTSVAGDITRDTQSLMGTYEVAAGAAVNVNLQISTNSVNPTTTASLRATAIFIPHV